MILCSGAFDGLHSGHVAYLDAVSMLTGYGTVDVAVAPDTYIRGTKQREPHWSQQERASAVQGLRAVRKAICQADDTPSALIRTLRPNAFVKGIDWVNKLPEDVVAACREVGCLIVYVDTEGKHTSEAIQ